MVWMFPDPGHRDSARLALLHRRDLLGPKNLTREKMLPFECGSESSGGRHLKLSVKFYLTAILFVVFDIEAVFIYPWAIQFRTLGWFGLIEMFSFLRWVRFSSRSCIAPRKGALNGRVNAQADRAAQKRDCAVGGQSDHRPRGVETGFHTTQLEALLGWARKHSLFAHPSSPRAAGMEFMARRARGST